MGSRAGTGRRRIALWAIALAAATAVVVAAVSVDLAARSQLSSTRRQLSSTAADLRQKDADVRRQQAELDQLGQRLDTTLADLKAVDATLSATAGDRSQLQQALVVSAQDLARAKGTLTGAQHTILAQGSRITDLDTCLTGVQQALNAISVGNRADAVNLLQLVSSACAQSGTTAVGASYPYDFPDPSVLTTAGGYYGYATNSAGGNIQVIHSTDMTHWTTMPDALPRLPAWAVPDFTWAPFVLVRNGLYVLFYTAAARASGLNCISDAVAPAPGGPFLDASAAPLVCGPSSEVDPAAYVDGTRAWLIWSQASPATIWSQPLSANGLALTGTPVALARPTQTWENGIVEAPAMVRIGGRLMLFYSGSNWNTANYAIGYAACATPAGPCVKPQDKPVMATSGSIIGPGGAAFFVDGSGRLAIAFHAWSPGGLGYPNSRFLYVRHVALAGAVPTFST